jgi:hypothetical protein
MEGRVLGVMGKVARLAGLAIGLCLFIYRSVIQQNLLFTTGLSSAQAFFVIAAVMILTFGVAIMGMMAWLMTFNSQERPIPLSSLVLLSAIFTIVLGSTVYLLSLAVIAPVSAQQTPKLPEAPVGAPTKPPSKTTKVCMGEGGGNNCLAGADAKFGCDVYHQWGAGGRMTQNLGENFCSVTENNSKKQQPFDVKVYQNNDGGRCGWTGFLVTCNP